MYARLSLKHKMRISPRLVVASRLLEIPTIDIEPLVAQELRKNPALELVRHYRARLDRDDRDRARPGPALDDLSEQLAAPRPALDQLVAQAAPLVAPKEREVLVGLIDSLDDRGYLRASTKDLSGQLGASRGVLERLIGVLHELEPPGIGARDLRECLAIQCAHLEARGADCHVPRRILTQAWDDFSQQRWQQVARTLRLSIAEVEDARRFIARNCYPYPLSLIQDTPASVETLSFPDLVIHRRADGGRPTFALELPGAAAFELRISESFEAALHTARRRLSPDERGWIQAYVEQARIFIDGLAQRWTTLRRVGERLIHHQAGYLERGARYLKPLTRAALAAELGLHESTVSRAVSDKVVQLPNGRLIPMSDLFDSSMAAREAIRHLLSTAQRHLSDREIAERLQAEGLRLARRTVTKYRRQLQIPSSRSRYTHMDGGGRWGQQT